MITQRSSRKEKKLKEINWCLLFNQTRIWGGWLVYLNIPFDVICDILSWCWRCASQTPSTDTTGSTASVNIVVIQCEHIDNREAKQSAESIAVYDGWWQSISKSIRILNVFSGATSFIESPFQLDDIFIFSYFFFFMHPDIHVMSPEKSPNRESLGLVSQKES